MRHIRTLTLLLPLAGLLWLILITWTPREDRPAATKSTLPMDAEPALQTAPPEPARRPAAPVPVPGGALWSYSGETEGDVDGLTPFKAALQRSGVEVPEGGRYRMSGFPDPRALREGDAVTVGLPDGRVFPGVVNYSRRDEGFADTHQVAIGFRGEQGGVVMTHDAVTSQIRGRVMVEGDRLLWGIKSGQDGALWLIEHLRADLLCGQPPALAAARTNPLPGDDSTPGTGTTAPVLNSRLAATAVLYLDFDGAARTSYPDWPAENPGGATFTVPHSSLSAAQMTTVWRRVAEDFIQFNINVTTQASKYSAAPVGRRMRLLVGSVLPKHVGGPGWAKLASFRAAELGYASNVPAWLEVAAYGSGPDLTDAELSSLASNASHEFGHALQLYHDGDDGVQPTPNIVGNYYRGHGTAPFDWSSIMGSPYRDPTMPTARAILQWAKNDYPGANNAQDDLAVIAAPLNGFGYAPDESTGFITATDLTATGKLRQFGGEGIIANKDDLDWWLFRATSTGPVTIEVAPADNAVSLPNLDCGFRIENALGDTVAGPFSFEDNLEVKATVTLSKGPYFVVAYGTGNKTWTTGGYDDYGSTGRYLVTVDLPADTTAPTPVITSPVAGVLGSPNLQFQGTATDDDRVSALGIYLRRNTDNAYWNGSYWQVGVATLARSYNETTGAWSCTSPLPQVGGSGPGSLNAGTYTFIVIAEDPAGHSIQTDVIVTVDSSGPTVAVSSPAGALGTSGYAFSGTSRDANGVQTVNCFIRRNSDGQYWNGSGWGAAATSLPTNHVAHATGNERSWACVASSLPQPGGQLQQGTYTFIAIATDPLGNHTQADSVVLIDDNQPPQVAVTTPSHNGFVNLLGSIGGTATDWTGIKDDRVTFTLYQVNSGRFWNGSEWVNDLYALHAPVTGGAWNFTAVPDEAQLTPDQYLISASAYDNANTLSQPTSGVNQISFRVERTPPQVAITAPLNGAALTSLSSVSGTASDANGIAAVRLYLYRFSDGQFWDRSSWGGGGSAILPTQISGNTWASAPGANLPRPGTNPASSLTTGSYNVIAFAIDQAGNMTRADAVFSVEVTYTWTGATLRDSIPNNDTHSWGEPANWEPYGVPGVEDIAVIANGDRVDSTVSRTVHGLRLSNGTLNFTNGAGPNGTLTTLVNSTWTGGTITGIWENEGTVTVSGAGAKTLWDSTTINNRGTITWQGEGPIQARSYDGSPVVINNLPGAIFRLAAGGSPLAREYGSRRPVFNNANGARLERDGGRETATLTIWEFHNAGEIRAQTGTLAFTDGPFDGYDLFLDPGTTLTGASTLRINNATQLNTAVNAQCPVELVADSWLGCPGEPGVARFEGALAWTGGVISGNLTFGPAAVVTVADAVPGAPVPKQLWDDTTIDNEGVITWQGGGPIRARNYTGTNAVVNNRNGGALLFAADGEPLAREYGSRTPVLNNLAGATLRKTAGSATTLLNTFQLNHTGNLICDSGVLAFNTEFNPATATPWTGAGDFEILGGTTNVTGPLVLNGPTLTIRGGNLNGAEDGSTAFTTTGGSTVEWLAGTWWRTLRLTANSVLNLSGPEPKLLWDDTTLNNDGVITWLGGGALQARAYDGAGVVVNNRSGARFQIAADGEPFARQYSSRDVLLRNQAGATFIRTVGSGTVTINSWIFTHEGQLTASTGVLAFNTTLNLNPGSALGGAGRFEQAAGRLNVNGATTLQDTSFTLLSGDLVGQTEAVWRSTGNGVWRWRSGTLSGSLEIAASSRLEIADPAGGTPGTLLWDNAELHNKGTISWSSAAPLRARAYDGVETLVRNHSGGVFRVLADGPWLTRDYGSRTPRFLNDAGAQVLKPQGQPAVPTTCDWSWENAGLTQVDGGRLELGRGGDSSGTFTAATGAVISFHNGTHTLRDGVIINGAGRVQIEGGAVVGEGTLHGQSAAPGAWALLGGTWDGARTYAGPGRFEWSGGTIAGSLTLASGTTTQLSGPDLKTMWDSTTIDNEGTITWQGGGPIRARNYDGGGAVINNRSGGSFQLAADGEPLGREYSSRTPVFHNLTGATLRKTAGSGTTLLHTFHLNHSGNLVCDSGVLAFNTEFQSTSSVPWTGSGRFEIQGGTTTITGPLALNGPTLTITGGSLHGAEDGSAAFATTGGSTVEWQAGTWWRTFRLTAGSVLNLSGPVPKVLWDDTTVNNDGIITWLGGGPLRARAYDGAGVVVNNRSGARFQIAADGDALTREYSSRAPVLNNAGSLRLGAPVASCRFAGWQFTQTASGALELDLAGPGLTQFDRLTVAGPATLGGAVQVTKLNGYTPAEDATFAVLTADSVSGSFATVGGGFSADYSATAVTLRAGGEEGLPFEDWAESQGLSGDKALPNADPDGDGYSNFFEYAFNMKPSASDAPPLETRTATIDNQPWFVLGYRRWDDRVAAGVTYTPQTKKGLGVWETSGLIDEEDPTAPAIPGSTARRLRIPIRVPVQAVKDSSEFLRVLVTKP